MTRGSQPQGGLSRRSGYALGLPLMPVDLFRMNPFSLMRRMTEELDRVFGEGNGGERTERAWLPAIEATERDGNYVVRAELPGLAPKDVKVEITEDAIVLQGERKEERDEDRGDVHVSERRYGKFYREIPLPEGAKAEEARAKFENGVLEISVPLQKEQSTRREIPVEGSSTGPAGNAPGKAGTSSGSQGTGTPGSTGGSEKAA